MRAPPSCPNHFPKAPPTHTTTLGIRISTYEFGEAGNIQSIALNIRVCSDFSSLSTDFSFFFSLIFCFRIPHSIQLSCLLQFSSVQFSRSVMSDSLRPHESQHARPPCPSPTPRVYPNPCPSSW